VEGMRGFRHYSGEIVANPARLAREPVLNCAAAPQRRRRNHLVLGCDQIPTRLLSPRRLADGAAESFAGASALT
jgi:hypothetical protein